MQNDGHFNSFLFLFVIVRVDCKFVHASKEDERRYLESGKLPPTAVNVTAAEASHEPICKDFLKSE